MDCCPNLNQINIFFHGNDNPKVFIYPCCQWLNIGIDKFKDLYSENIDLNYFKDIVMNRRLFLYNNRKEICEKCKGHSGYLEKFLFKPEILTIFCSSVCNLNCPYCFGKTDDRNVVLNNSFLNNRDIVEEIIADPSIKIIRSCGNGEFFANKILMDLYLSWKIKYGKKISVITNFTLYNPDYPIDELQISWHKAADKDVFISNLSKISNKYENINIYMMIGKPEYAFTLEEAYELVKKNLEPKRFSIFYTNLLNNNGDDIYSTGFTEEDKKIIRKTIYLGFRNVRFIDYINGVR